MTAKRNTKHKRIYRILIPVILGVFVFVLFKPTIVNVMAKEEDLSLFLTNSNVEVDTKKGKNGFSQIKYKFNNRDIDLTESDVTNADPDTDGEYIAWMAQIDGFWQILLHYLPSGQTIQLSGGENNVNPSVSGNMVAWEGQVNGIWQVFLFDGIRTIQITNGLEPVQDVGIDDGVVVFSQKDPSGQGWNVYMYTVIDAKLTLLTPDTFGRGVTIENGLITWLELDGEGYVSKNLSLVVSEKTTDEASNAPSEGETSQEVPEIIEEASETTESTSIVEDNTPVEIIELILEKETETPKQVTEEDIKRELGIGDDSGVEGETEEIIDSIQEDSDTTESTESTSSETLEN